MLELFLDGGIMMYPLLLASVLALAIFTERLFALRRKNILSNNLIQTISGLRKKEDLERLETIAAGQENTLSRLVLFLLQFKHLQRDEQKEIIEEQGRQEIRFLKKRLKVLDTIAGVAPLLGLLGTVLGMIRVFCRTQSRWGCQSCIIVRGDIGSAAHHCHRFVYRHPDTAGL
jgi:biopolymer transport protein ExbB